MGITVINCFSIITVVFIFTEERLQIVKANTVFHIHGHRAVFHAQLHTFVN